MNQYNLSSPSVETAYNQGLLPQRNQPGSFYSDSSSRCQLSNFTLSSENRRILQKTSAFTYTVVNLTDFSFTIDTQKQIYNWIKQLQWDFPISSVKTIFKDHIFNKLYIWSHNNQVCAYSICYFEKSFSHIAYVFYDPQYFKTNLPIRLALQVVIDSQQAGLNYCYLGRFDPETKLGYYKRTFPNFQYFQNGQWISYSSGLQP